MTLTVTDSVVDALPLSDASCVAVALSDAGGDKENIRSKVCDAPIEAV